LKGYGRKRMTTPFRLVAGVIAGSALALATTIASSTFADDYPNKPIKVISDSAPGSAIDVMFRMVMDRLGTELGQQIVPIDRPGAGGAIAAHAASESIADGYTLFAPALSLFISLPGKAENLPLILPRDFLPVGSLAELPMFICASVQSGIKTLPDLIARAKERPGDISFAATGIGRLTHLTGLLLASKAGIKLAAVPYAGGPAAALTDVIGNRVPLVIEGYSGLAGAIQAHTVNALAVASTHRLADFPDLPTVAETLPGFAAGGWQGIVAPLGTPAPAIQKINATLKKVLSDPELGKQLATRGAYVAPMSPSEVNTFINAQQEQWRPVLEAFEASVKK
jgi:tripartite-type tricarboxylate transporter receptor subunit TctC